MKKYVHEALSNVRYRLKYRTGRQIWSDDLELAIANETWNLMDTVEWRNKTEYLYQLISTISWIRDSLMAEWNMAFNSARKEGKTIKESENEAEKNLEKWIQNCLYPSEVESFKYKHSAIA